MTGALPSHSPRNGQRFCCLGLRTDGTICQTELFGTLFCKYDHLGTTSTLRLPLRLDLDLQRQTEDNPYISSFLDRKQSENQREEPCPRESFHMRMPQGSWAVIRVLWRQVIGYICGKGTVK